MRCSENGKPLARCFRMPHPPPLPAFAAIIVAAGKGIRAGQPLPKQFAEWRGKPVLRHSVETLLEAGAAPLVIAIPENGEAAAHTALDGLAGYTLVAGGETRQQSVARALSAIESADTCLLYTSPSPRDKSSSRMPSSA